jgi:hypothetical protein
LSRQFVGSFPSCRHALALIEASQPRWAAALVEFCGKELGRFSRKEGRTSRNISSSRTDQPPLASLFRNCREHCKTHPRTAKPPFVGSIPISAALNHMHLIESLLSGDCAEVFVRGLLRKVAIDAIRAEAVSESEGFRVFVQVLTELGRHSDPLTPGCAHPLAIGTAGKEVFRVCSAGVPYCFPLPAFNPQTTRVCPQ